MADPNPAPNDTVSNIEGARSTSPAEGSGLQHALLDPSQNSLRRGRVDDIYMGSFCAIVSVYSYRVRVPCIWLEGAMNRYSGARRITPPSIGTEVLVWLSNDHKFGIVLGTLNSPTDRTERVKQSIAHTKIDHFSKDEIHDPKMWGVLGMLLNSSSGIPKDVFPGDDVTINENGAAIAVLKFVALLRGSEAAKIEAFIHDELVRVTAFNYQFRSATGERNRMSDFGQVDDTEEFTHRLGEGMGVGGPGKVVEGREAGRWRWKRFWGALGDFYNRILCRPHISPGSLDTPETRQDMGLQQEVLEMNGHHIQRSVAGLGMHKSIQIGVPKRRFSCDDPGGDNEIVKEPKAKEDFVFSDEFPNARIAQANDYFAWLYSQNATKRLLDKPKDWDVPDEATCPVPGGQEVRKPGLSGFYREVLPSVAALGDHEDYEDDTKVDGKRIIVGDSFVHLMTDGTVIIKAACGSSATLANGHIEFSCSNDIRFLAGGSIVMLAGDDIALRARQAIDITSTDSQIRVKGEREVFIHSEKGGMLLSLGGRGAGFVPNLGEDRSLPGIAIKVPDGGGFSVAAGQATYNLESRFYITGQKPDQYPEIETEAMAMYHWMQKHGSVAYRFDKKYFLFQEGSFYGSGKMQVDGDIYARKDIISGGIIGGILYGPGDWSKVPTLASLMEKAKVFDESIWEGFQYPYKLDDYPDLLFGFRTTGDYGTSDGNWIESFWQRDLRGELEPWIEKPCADKEYPYPGRHHFEGYKTLWVYNEGNVDSKTGRPKPRSEQKKEGGQFDAQNWNSLTVLPRR